MSSRLLSTCGPKLDFRHGERLRHKWRRREIFEADRVLARSARGGGVGAAAAV